MNNEILAFLTGLFGSLHCVAMCGPLVMSLPLSSDGWFSLLQRLLYQSGRIFTYSTLGFVAGMVGTGFNILGLQQLLSLSTGLLLIAIAVFHFSDKTITGLNKLQYRIVAPIASLMGKWLTKSYGGLFAGALHGFLPCGMVYMAIAASLNVGSPLAGSRFMFFFGLGTTPLLLFASFAPFFFRQFKAWRLMIPVLFFIAGCFLIVRTFNVQLPHVHSSVMRTNSIPVCK